jgi:hypothetical protein
VSHHRITVSEPVALSLRALADYWSITVGARLDGGRAATSDGTPVVVKVSIPPGDDAFGPFERQLAALRSAGGDPYVRLIVAGRVARVWPGR